VTDPTPAARRFNLGDQRCFNHSLREAAARCPECNQFFCRECITEHEDRVVCAACLLKLARVPLTRRAGFVTLTRLVQCALGFLVAWLFFFVVGDRLLQMPDSFHEQTFWKVRTADRE
jgi:hypothetical protein